jgi:hypothetical protein
MKLPDFLTDKSKLAKTSMGAMLVFFIGFFGDFQVLKTKVEAFEVSVTADLEEVKSELKIIEQIRDLNCEIAIHTFKEDNQMPEKILKHCR